MDRRTVLALVMSLTIWYTWVLFFSPEPVVEETGEAPVVPTEAPTPTPVAPTPSASHFELVKTPVDACGANAEWRSDGGLSNLHLDGFKAAYTVTPIYTFVMDMVSSGETTWNPYGDEPGPAEVLSPEARVFSVGSGELSNPAAELESQDSLAFSGTTSDGLRVSQKVTVSSEPPCTLIVDVTWTNQGGTAFDGNLWVGAHDHLDDAGGMMARYGNARGAWAMVDGSVENHTDLEELAEGPVLYEGPTDWFGISDRYFAVLTIPETPEEGQLYFSGRKTDTDIFGVHWVHEASLAPGASYSQSFRTYIGPKELDQLAAVDERLQDVVQLGWFSFFGFPLMWLLKLFYSAVGQWGVAIILLTFTVKVIFFPLTQSAFKSGQAMQAIQPLMQEVRETYKDDPETMNRELMKLMQDNGVNPLGGCLPMLIQFPVWIALYNVLLSSVDLYQTEFLYLRDLSSVDPYGVLPAIVVVLMMIQQQFTPTGNMDPAQARILKLMPLMMGVFFFTFPSGLVVYIFVNMTLSVLQQWLIKRTYQAPAAPASGA